MVWMSIENRVAQIVLQDTLDEDGELWNDSSLTILD